MKSSRIALSFLLLVLMAGCGGGGSGTPPPALVAITVTPANPSIALGTAEQFTATGTFADNSMRDITTSVTWASSVPGVATVSNAGSITSVSTGTTTITAKSGNVSGFATLTVTVPVPVAITVAPAISSILTGSTEQFAATVMYSDNSLSTSVTWISSAPDVATIDVNGVATAISTATTATTMIMARSGSVTGSAALTVTGGNAAPASNVLPITVNGSLCSSSTSANYPNKPCVSVTVCNPGTSTCATIYDILLDTGSFGLRIFKSVMSSLSLTQVVSGSGSLAECAQFGDGSTEWGPVQLADVTLGNETAKSVPIHVISFDFTPVPSTCGTPATRDTSPSVAGFNGILGVGVFAADCGSVCETNASNGIYYSCNGSTCTGAAVPVPNQVQNPVALLPGDNNGVIVELPSVPSSGSPSVDGILVLGIGTRTNNSVPSLVTAYKTGVFGEIVTIFGNTYPAIIDSGSNGLFFTPPSTILLPDCSANPEWFCPSSATTLSATNEGTSGSPSGDVFFQIGNFDSLISSPNRAFSNIGGPTPGLFDWGLPFYFGRNIFVGFEGRMSSSLGTGPYFAY